MIASTKATVDCEAAANAAAPTPTPPPPPDLRRVFTGDAAQAAAAIVCAWVPLGSALALYRTDVSIWMI
jgi:hypothetical protein